MKREKPIVAIDGPVGVGKSTVAKALADKLDFLYIDTGAMYRAATLAAMRAEINLDDFEKVKRAINKINIELKREPNGLRTYLNGEDVSDEIRLPEVSKNTSPIADNVAVRELLVSMQQEIGKTGGVVME